MLKLPIPDKSLKNKDIFSSNKQLNSYEHSKLVLPASPKDMLMQEEKLQNYFSPMHIQHVTPLSPLSMSQTNDSVDMSSEYQ